MPYCAQDMVLFKCTMVLLLWAMLEQVNVISMTEENLGDDTPWEKLQACCNTGFGFRTILANWSNGLNKQTSIQQGRAPGAVGTRLHK